MDELKGKRIFIVEDDITNMAVYAATLKRSGAIIIQDFWNAGTVRLLTQHLPVDIILLDLMLRHNLSGYDIFQELKENPDLAGIPVVAVSAADPTVEIPKARALGFAGFIGKPINSYRFPQQILTCLSGGEIWYSQNGYPEDLV